MIKRVPPSPSDVLASVGSLGLCLERIDAKALEELVAALSSLLGVGESEILELTRLLRHEARDTSC
ncbi:MAG: hypothetical protein QXX77_08965 [Candidatus Methanosuratincola sp.]